MNLTDSLPPLNSASGFRGGYRLFRAETGVDFAQMRTLGYSLVVVDGWCSSASSLDRFFSSPEVVAQDDRKHAVSVHRNLGIEVEYHPLHGEKFDSKEAADEARFKAGVLAFMVYEEHRAERGLA